MNRATSGIQPMIACAGEMFVNAVVPSPMRAVPPIIIRPEDRLVNPCDIDQLVRIPVVGANADQIVAGLCGAANRRFAYTKRKQPILRARRDTVVPSDLVEIHLRVVHAQDVLLRKLKLVSATPTSPPGGYI